MWTSLKPRKYGAFIDTQQHLLWGPPEQKNVLMAGHTLRQQSEGTYPQYLRTQQIDLEET